MPEGDSLIRLVHRLRPVMQDQVIKHADFRAPRLATVELTNWTVHRVTSTGKYLSMIIRAPENTEATYGELVILSHLGMDGSWQVDAQPTHRTRCILSFDDHRIVGFNLADLDVLTLEKARQRLAYLGPDILDAGWQHPGTADDLRSAVLKNFRQAIDQPIATALLDQRLVAGIGNIYRCEVLFLAGISPYRLLSELTEQQLAGLIGLSHDLMAMNIPPTAGARTRRTTVDVRPDVHAPFGVRVATATERARALSDQRRQRGKTPSYWVYGRQREGCLRCGGPVRVASLGAGPANERTIYWCPHCQRS